MGRHDESLSAEAMPRSGWGDVLKGLRSSQGFGTFMLQCNTQCRDIAFEGQVMAEMPPETA
jgi:hypothetical protein